MYEKIVLSKELCKIMAMDIYDIIVQDIRAEREEAQAENTKKENHFDKQDLKSA